MLQLEFFEDEALPENASLEGIQLPRVVFMRLLGDSQVFRVEESLRIPHESTFEFVL